MPNCHQFRLILVNNAFSSWRYILSLARVVLNESLSSVKVVGFSKRRCFLCQWVKKIGPQCVLGVLCLISFLSVAMLFSNISMWELNCYKWKGRQVITTLKWKMYGRMLFTYFISNNNWRLSCKKGVYGLFHVTDITFRGQVFGTKTFPYIVLFV